MYFLKKDVSVEYYLGTVYKHSDAEVYQIWSGNFNTSLPKYLIIEYGDRYPNNYI